MKPTSLLFLNITPEQALPWSECAQRQDIVKDIFFIDEREKAEEWKESITIEGGCSGFYDLKLFLTNCRRDRAGEGRMVELVATPPFFSLTDDFDCSNGEDGFCDGYRETGIIYRNKQQSRHRICYPQVSFEKPSPLFCQRPALFLDRDGVINVDNGYIYRSEDIELCVGIEKLIETAKKRGWWVCVVSNQSGVGRGYYSLEQVESLHKFLGETLPVDQWFFCPYHPDGVGEYRGISHCRKPNPGMILKAEQTLPIDRLNSLMVGDKESDRIHLQGLESVLIQGRYDLDHGKGRVCSGLDEIEERL